MGSYHLVSVISISVLVQTVLVLVKLVAKWTLESGVSLGVLVYNVSLHSVLVFTNCSAIWTLESILNFNVPLNKIKYKYLH